MLSGALAAARTRGAASEQSAPEAERQWAHLLPAGEVTGRDGRGPYRLDAAAVLAAFDAHGGTLPVDYEHQSLSAAEKSGPVPAAGWIEALESRADGIWGLVRWTERARELLAAREYRYLSPVFRYEPASGRVVALDGAGLTHTPNLAELRAAASAQPPTDSSTGDRAAMPTDAPAAAMTLNQELLERVRYMLNLPTLATAAEMVAQLERLIERLSEAETAAETAAAAAQAAQSAAAPDPQQWVARAEHQRLVAAHEALTAQVAAAAADAAIAAAQAAGRLTPAMLDWARAYARSDPAGFAAWAAAAPQVAPDNGTQHTAPPGDGADPQAIARAAQALQAEQQAAGVRLSFAEAVAQVLRAPR